MPAPAQPKVYHIIHVDRLASIISDGGLWSDAVLLTKGRPGTTIGMSSIKERRLHELQLSSRPGLFVGHCVPFYFCPRSVMLFIIHRANQEGLNYHGGQGPIIHLESDLRRAVAWAEQKGRRWAFTLSNAGAYYFEDRCNLDQLEEINWSAVETNRWSGPGVSPQLKDGKQAEFLVEHSFPWRLVERVGVQSRSTAHLVYNVLQNATHRPVIEVRSDWYY